MKINRRQLRRLILEELDYSEDYQMSTHGGLDQDYSKEYDEIEQLMLTELERGAVNSNKYLLMAVELDETNQGYSKIFVGLGKRENKHMYAFSSAGVAQQVADALNNNGGFIGIDFEVEKKGDSYFVAATAGMALGKLP